MTGREVKAKAAQLMHRHGVKPVERAPIPLLSPVTSPQIIEAVAASADIDADRTSFARGSLSWDLNKLPLLVRHTDKVAGRILTVDYQADGKLVVCARIDDLDAARMGGMSIAATVTESEVCNEASPTGWHFVVRKARVDEISMTDRPANARAIITSRRNVEPRDDSHDAMVASLGRMRKALDGLKPVLMKFVDDEPAPQLKSNPLLNITPSVPMIYNRLPGAYMRRPQDSFSRLVARLPIGEEWT